MYMMIRKKVSKITDKRLVKFLESKQTRDELFDEFDLQFHEKEQVLGVGFQIRDRVKQFIDLKSNLTVEKSIPFVLEMHKLAFPDSEASNKFDRMTQWLLRDKWSHKVCLATGIYFLNHFKGNVESETVYVY